MNKSIPMISIIMPTYNCAKWIKTAITSIQDQTMENWELLIVDNCSKDETCSVVKGLLGTDSRIRLFESEVNMGPGTARNIGIQNAKGEYITFCDGDDWLEKEALAKLLSCTDDFPDVVVAGYYRDICSEHGGLLQRSLVSMEEKRCTSSEDVLSFISELDEKRLFSFVWNKLYKKSVIDKYNVQFSDKQFGEDYDFNIAFFGYVSSMVVLKTGFYHYIKCDGESLSERYIPDFYEINLERFEKMKCLMESNHIYDGAVRASILNSYIKHVLTAISRLNDPRGQLSKKEKQRKTAMMLSDHLSVEALCYAKANTRKEKACNAVFKTKSVWICLAFGKILWFMSTKGKKVYEKMK